MPTPVTAALTRGENEREVARRLGWLVYPSETESATADAGSASTLDDDALVDASGARMVDGTVITIAGTGSGQARRISAFTAGSDRITPTPNWATNPDSTTGYFVIHSKGSAAMLTRGVREAWQRLTFHRRLGMGFLKESGPRREVMLGNALINPLFDLYTTANVPDNWVDANSTLTQETTITYGGARRSLKIVTDGANVATLTQSLAEVGRYIRHTLATYAWVYATTASEVFLRITDGGTAASSSLHGGAGWEKLLVNYVVTDDASELTASLRTTTAGSTITFYAQVAKIPKVPSDDHVYDIDADQNFVVLNGYMKISGRFNDSGGRVGDFDRNLGPGEWEMLHEATRRVRLNIDMDSNGRVLEYSGWVNHAEPTATTTSMPFSPSAIQDVAEAYIRSRTGDRDKDSPDPVLRGDVEGAVVAALSRAGIAPARPWKLVEPQ